MAMSIRQPEPAVEKAYAAFAIAAGSILLAVLGLEFDYYRNPVVSSFAFDIGGLPVGRDFLNTWMGGRSRFPEDRRRGSTSAPTATWYGTKSAIRTCLREYYFWYYPPHFLFFVAAFGLLPFLPLPLMLWLAATLAAYVATLAGILGRTRRRLLAVAFPAVAVNITAGQNGFLTAALIGGARTAGPAADSCRHLPRDSDQQAAIRFAVAYPAGADGAGAASLRPRLRPRSALAVIVVARFGTTIWEVFANGDAADQPHRCLAELRRANLPRLQCAVRLAGRAHGRPGALRWPGIRLQAQRDPRSLALAARSRRCCGGRRALTQLESTRRS